MIKHRQETDVSGIGSEFIIVAHCRESQWAIGEGSVASIQFPRDETKIVLRSPPTNLHAVIEIIRIGLII
jgi:hypothetical protein